EDFQQRLAAAAVGTIDTSSVPDALAGIVQPVVEAAASSMTGLPGYQAAWEETLRKSHRLSFADPASRPAAADSSSSLTLDVAPLVTLAIGELSRITGMPVDAPDQTLINVGQPDQRQWIERLSAYAPLGYSLAIGAGVALALAFVAARRRWTVIFGVGAGALLLAALWTVGSLQVRDAVAGTASGNEVADMFTDEFVAAAFTSFQSWITGTAVAGAVLVVAGLVIGVASRGRRALTR
ncbi:MAG TPA: hypothetical protein VD841_11490, partial [Arthrobacter sp.]|nr:hypothetical protein [Arthrobacter sp.]